MWLYFIHFQSNLCNFWFPGDIEEDDHYDSVIEKKNDNEVTNNPYYGAKSEDQVNNDEIRQSTFDKSENVKVSNNPYYE